VTNVAEETGSARLPVKVVPGAKRTELAGWLGDALKVRVAVPAERGRANRAVVTLIARTLGIREGAIRIESGQTSRRKVLLIEGFSEAELRARLTAQREGPAT